jgi:Tfp pilus assembly protein PilO
MNLSGTSTNRIVIAMLIVVGLGVAFWMLLLGPKREEASKLDADVQNATSLLEQHRAEVADAEAARKQFPSDYRRLVVLGKAVPGDDDTASLLVQVNGIARSARIRFSELSLTEGGAGEGVATTAPAPSTGATASTPISPTEAAASTLPLGATVGPAGLGVMPYSLAFEGNFFRIADFVNGLDSLVKTGSKDVIVDGRLITIDGFALEAHPEFGFPLLRGTFSVTSYLTPPNEGATGGATPTEPAPATATPASTTLGGTP